MKLTTGILALGMAAGTAWGQNPDVIENTKNTVNNVEQKKAMDENAAMATTPATKPAASAGGTAQSSSKPKAAPVVHVAAQPKVVAKPTAGQAKTKVGGRKEDVTTAAEDRRRGPEETCRPKKGRHQEDQLDRTAGPIRQPGGEPQHVGLGL